MRLTDREMLVRLGAGETIASVCEAAGVGRAEFDAWWKKQIAARVPKMDGKLTAGVSASAEIRRDDRGIPHIFAANEPDLFFAYGVAMAQDRLFQLDWLRRRGSGRTAEIVGKPGLEYDLVVRTVGLQKTAEGEWSRLPHSTQEVLTWFAAGINAVIEQSRGNLPIEFDLLGYEPERWTPIDSLVVEGEFRWYLTGRFPIIVMPELAKRTLGDGPLWREFCLGELDEETIIPRGYYKPVTKGTEPVGLAMGGPDSGIGSNNWVVGGKLTADGKPMVASDPHIAFEAVSCWYEAHLSGGRYNVAGMTYVGMPAIMFGRNERVAWGITNNICSLRDLYQERTDPAHPGCYLYDGQWEPAREVVETIRVKRSTQGAALSTLGAGSDGDLYDTVTKTIHITRNGPIVDEILPAPGNKSGPVSLKWLGTYQGGWLTSLHQLNRAKNVTEFREALRPWHVPTFCLVFADVDGGVGMQSSGRIPIRKAEERGYRPGWCPDHQWQGLTPFDHMPGVMNPERGWMATANHRLAPPDYPYALFGRWSNGARGLRIRQMIESQTGFTRDTFRDMQQDSLNLRGPAGVPGILSAVRDVTDARARAAADALQAWDGTTLPDSVGTTIFNVFFTSWARRVADERFDRETSELVMKGSEGVAARLLNGDPNGWFHKTDRVTAIKETFLKTVGCLSERFGSDVSKWTWGKLHKMPLKHVLSARGDLSQLLDHAGDPIRGDMLTVCNTGAGPDWTAVSGAGYRLIAELGSHPPMLWAVDGQSQSGHPGSPHYSDQFADWAEGRYHALPLSREELKASTVMTIVGGR